MTNFINLTPHTIRLTGALGEYALPSNGVARVDTIPGDPLTGPQDIEPGEDTRAIALPIPGLYRAPTFGAVVGLPDPSPGTIYIVSGVVAGAVRRRPDVFSPGTGPHDAPVRENGQVVAVTRLIQSPQL